MTALPPPAYCSLMNKRSRQAEAVVFSLLGAAQVVEARLEAALGGVGLSLAKAGVLRYLAEAREPLPLSELAKHQKCVRSNITQLVDRLERDGLVRRRADPADRRSVRAALTPRGVRAHARALRVLAAEQRGIVRALSARDAATLAGALASLVV